MSKAINWTEQQKQWIKNNQYGKSRADLFKEFLAVFDDVDSRANQNNFEGLISRMGLKNGKTGCFSKGHDTWNKGKTGYMGANRGSFKKGQLPKNHRPVGSERICAKDGYVIVKIAESAKWVPKHKWLYEQTHGKLKHGWIVRFIDGDKMNISLDNLVAVPQQANAVLNLHNKPNTSSSELNRAIMLTETLNQYAKGNVA